jgi:hypothetical protein
MKQGRFEARGPIRFWQWLGSPRVEFAGAILALVFTLATLGPLSASQWARLALLGLAMIASFVLIIWVVVSAIRFYERTRAR